MSPSTLVIVSLIAVYLLWVLLPLVPAIIIYRLFPNGLTELVGKVAGYTIKAGGAFAAYLAVVLVTYSQIDEINKGIYASKHQFWTVIGQIQLADAQGQRVNADHLISALTVVSRPEPYFLDKYQIRLKVPEDPQLPVLVFKIPKFGEQRLDWKSLTRDYANGTINIEQIIIKQDPAAAGPVTTSTVRLESGSAETSTSGTSSSATR